MKIALRRWSAFVPLLPVVLLASCTIPVAPPEALAPPMGHSKLLSAQDRLELQDWGLKFLWRHDLGQLSASRPLKDIFSCGKFVVVEADKGEIHCINSGTGVWKATAVLRDSLERPPTAFGDRLYLVVNDELFTFETASDRLSAGHDPGFPLSTAPLTYKDKVVLVGTNGFLSLLPLAGGEPRWLVSLDGAIFEQPVLDGDVLYASSSVGNMVLAWDLGKDHEMWQWSPRAPSRISSGVGVEGGSVYVGDNLGFIHALKAGTGEESWKVMLEAPVVGKITVAGSKVLVLTDKPSLVCLSAADQRQLLWHYDGVVRVLTIGKQVAYVLKDNHSVAAVNLDTGKEMWSDPLGPNCKVAGDAYVPAFYIATSQGSIVAFKELD
jgi:outer membrane protein assembly factor BamB